MLFRAAQQLCCPVLHLSHNKSHMHAQRRERANAGVLAALMQPGAARALRPGPWMLAAADDPAALPGELTAERDSDHLLRVRRPITLLTFLFPLIFPLPLAVHANGLLFCGGICTMGALPGC